MTVKSILVWKAKMLRARTTVLVTPTAIMTSEILKWEATVPIMKPSAKVKTPRRMKLPGALRRMSSGQQGQISVNSTTKLTTAAKMYSHEFTALQIR